MWKYGFCAGGMLPEMPGLGSRQQDLGENGSPGVLVVSKMLKHAALVVPRGLGSRRHLRCHRRMGKRAEDLCCSVCEARPLNKTLWFSSLLLDESRPARDEGFAGGVAESFGHGKRCLAESPARSEFFTQK